MKKFYKERKKKSDKNCYLSINAYFHITVKLRNYKSRYARRKASEHLCLLLILLILCLLQCFHLEIMGSTSHTVNHSIVSS